MKINLGYFLLFATLWHISPATAQENMQAKKPTIRTTWADQVDATNVLSAYPRPQMVRESWINLNGLWDYAVLPATQRDRVPTSFNGKILVPFAIEADLSGIGKTVGKDSILWYRHQVEIPAKYKNQSILLHFGAVDWEATVYVNGKKVGTHQGAFDPFVLDITPFLKRRGRQEIIVAVWDPIDDGPQPRGKQVKKPESIWYTSVSGIWQTVWLEPVPATHISALKPTPDIDSDALKLLTQVQNLRANDKVHVSVWEGEKKVLDQIMDANKEGILKIPNPKRWSPDEPFLYDLRVSVVRNNRPVDAVSSYFGMRKISLAPDANGIQRIMLNDAFVFQYGTLDQGWWPDGLYTAPTDEALKYDIDMTKAMGFNMIRKHVKVEPARWYYHCDQAGILVWQDMPSGESGGRWSGNIGIEGIAEDVERTAASEAIFRNEWAAIMEDLHHFSSIVVWVPFNEAWGQFKTAEITNWTMENDPSRLVNSASGGNFYPVGHIIDIHNYPDPAMPRTDLFGKNRALVLGEFGGLGLPVEGHTWQQKDNWGYRTFSDDGQLYERYAEYINKLVPMIRRGLSAAVYTQTTDVEIEINGLMTYDRKVIKMPADKLQDLHQKLYQPELVKLR